MKLTDAIQDYILHIKVERGLSKNTVLHYQSNLRALHRWLGENGYTDPTIQELNLPTLRRYLYGMSAKGLRPRSIHTAFHGIRGLCVFLTDNGAITANPVLGMTMPKKDAAERRSVTDEEVRLLQEAAERQRTPRQIALYRAMLAVLAYGGLRRAEVCDLHLDDINIREKSILVRQGKGRKSRKIYVCQDCVDAIGEWLAVREKDCQGDWFFMLDRGRRVHYQGIASIVNTLKSTAGLRDRHITPHALRHNCASRLLRNGADLKSIQTFLGHTMLQTTAVYLHSSEEQLRDIAELGSLAPRSPATQKLDRPADKGRSRRLPPR